MIKLKEICKYYESGHQRTFALKSINLEVEDGEFVSVIGPSNAGKSTLLNIIGLLDEPSEGDYLLFEEPVATLKDEMKVEYYKKQIGFISKVHCLVNEMTVYNNIEAPLIYKDFKNTERKAIVSDLLHLFNLNDKKDLFLTELSVSEQQLVSIAQAIAGKPKLLLADEPTSDLNDLQSHMVMDLLRTLNSKGMTIIQAIQSREFAEYGKRIITLTDGRVVDAKVNDSKSVEVNVSGGCAKGCGMRMDGWS